MAAISWDKATVVRCDWYKTVNRQKMNNYCKAQWVRDG